MSLQFGVDQLITLSPVWKDKRIGMLTNDAATTNKGKSSRVELIKNGFNIVTLFSPEHGIHTTGADGAKMMDSIDPLTSLKVVSLYGSKFKPTANDLQDIDILLFDVPDAGTRFYTYLWTMTYWLEAAGNLQKEIIILDRPNPLGGNFELAEGPLLESAASSFIGRFRIPVKHQCTLGELAVYFNETQQWKAPLQIINCQHWNRTDLFTDWKMPWVNPSPALQQYEACILYPGLCFFEATNISVGRSTPYSFQWLGAPWLNINALNSMVSTMLEGEIKINPLTLLIPNENTSIPTTGIQIKAMDPKSYDAVMTGLLLLKLIKDIHPNDFTWRPYPTGANPTGNNHLTLLMGIAEAEALFELPLQLWLAKITKLLKVDHWKQEVAPYLLY